MPDKQSITNAQMAAWTTILLGFGLAQSAIYLRAYWSPFGIDPFQFGSVSDLAMMGLTGIGVTLALILGGALIGSYLASKASPLIERNHWIGWVLIALMVFGSIALILLIDFGIQLVIGMLLTWALLWLTHRSPDLPPHIKSLPALPYIAFAIAYIPMAAHHYGERKAKEITNPISTWSVDVKNSIGLNGMTESTRLAGRLGSDYIFYDAHNKSVSIVPANSATKIVIKRSNWIRLQNLNPPSTPPEHPLAT